MKKNHLLYLAAAALLCVSCKEDDTTSSSSTTDVPTEETAEVVGMYLLNEGNWGSNKSSIDYLDYSTGEYIRNLYAERNPTVVMGLGDVGSDIQVYGSRLYAVVNGSNKLEVMDAVTCLRIGQVDIPNCHFVRFHKGYAYVSSYVSNSTDANRNSTPGAVYKIDTLTLKVVGTCTVGLQPEELAVVGDRMYVANSGGYSGYDKGVYDNTVSVIDLNTFTELEKITVDINLHHIKADSEGKLWVTSRGDYYNVPYNFYVLKNEGGKTVVTDTLNLACTDFDIKGDSLYYYSSEWNYETNSNTYTYGIINTNTRQKVSGSFITDGTQGNIVATYGIKVHPTTGDIYLTDAMNYVSSGKLHCYSKDGTHRWSVTTGDIPAHICFYKK